MAAASQTNTSATSGSETKSAQRDSVLDRAQESFDVGVWAALDLCRQHLGRGEDYNPFDAFERRIILLALRETRGNQLRAARLLGISRSTLRKRVKRYEISIGMRVIDLPAPARAPEGTGAPVRTNRRIEDPEAEQTRGAGS